MGFPKVKVFFKISLINLTLFLIFYSSIFASPLSPWSGKVVGVSDGDTITVMQEGKGVKVRLSEIDCPEKGQPFGNAAKKFTSDACYSEIVTVNPSDIDKYGRVVAHVLLPNGKDLSEEILKAGLAWHYKQYSQNEKLADLENEARSAKKGLWADPNPIPPWQYRHPDAPAQTNISQTDEKSQKENIQYHGNRSSHIFHEPTCQYYNCKNCIVIFNSRDEALKAGFRPCKICNP